MILMVMTNGRWSRSAMENKVTFRKINWENFERMFHHAIFQVLPHHCICRFYLSLSVANFFVCFTNNRALVVMATAKLRFFESILHCVINVFHCNTNQSNALYCFCRYFFDLEKNRKDLIIKNCLSIANRSFCHILI